jgi:hypothetical protein
MFLPLQEVFKDYLIHFVRKIKNNHYPSQLPYKANQAYSGLKLYRLPGTRHAHIELPVQNDTAFPFTTCKTGSFDMY